MSLADEAIAVNAFKCLWIEFRGGYSIFEEVNVPPSMLSPFLCHREGAKRPEAASRRRGG